MGEATRLTDTVRDLLESGRRERLSQILEDAHAADIAAALRELPLPDQVTLFRLLGREAAGAVLTELGDRRSTSWSRSSTRARSRASSIGCGRTTAPRSSRRCPPSRSRRCWTS
jgi:hypothetical protein